MIFTYTYFYSGFYPESIGKKMQSVKQLMTYKPRINKHESNHGTEIKTLNDCTVFLIKQHSQGGAEYHVLSNRQTGNRRLEVYSGREKRAVESWRCIVGVKREL